MDIKTLESLGIKAEDLGERIVDQAVYALLNSTGFDPDNEEETRYDSKFKREIEARIQKAVDEKISALAAKHLVPRVSEMIENANLQKTNNYGEKRGEPLSFIEYLVERAESYMTERVDYAGQSKEESGSSYNWRDYGPRLTVLMKTHIRTELENITKKAMGDVNSTFAKAVEQCAKDAISAAAETFKISVSVK